MNRFFRLDSWFIIVCLLSLIIYSEVLIFMIISLDYNANIRLFGSCATGLALPESDIDFGITGFEFFPSA